MSNEIFVDDLVKRLISYGVQLEVLAAQSQAQPIQPIADHMGAQAIEEAAPVPNSAKEWMAAIAAKITAGKRVDLDKRVARKKLGKRQSTSLNSICDLLEQSIRWVNDDLSKVSTCPIEKLHAATQYHPKTQKQLKEWAEQLLSIQLDLKKPSLQATIIEDAKDAKDEDVINHASVRLLEAAQLCHFVGVLILCFEESHDPFCQMCYKSKMHAGGYNYCATHTVRGSVTGELRWGRKIFDQYKTRLAIHEREAAYLNPHLVNTPFDVLASPQDAAITEGEIDIVFRKLNATLASIGAGVAFERKSFNLSQSSQCELLSRQLAALNCTLTEQMKQYAYQLFVALGVEHQQMPPSGVFADGKQFDLHGFFTVWFHGIPASTPCSAALAALLAHPDYAWMRTGFDDHAAAVAHQTINYPILVKTLLKQSAWILTNAVLWDEYNALNPVRLLQLYDEENRSLEEIARTISINKDEPEIKASSVAMTINRYVGAKIIKAEQIDLAIAKAKEISGCEIDAAGNLSTRDKKEVGKILAEMNGYRRPFSAAAVSVAVTVAAVKK